MTPLPGGLAFFWISSLHGQGRREILQRTSDVLSAVFGLTLVIVGPP
jgi:hypothetical protein